MWDGILKNPQKLGKLTETAFKAIDINGNGVIQMNQLQQIMRSTAQDMGIQKPSKEQVKQVLKEIDKTNKGHLNKSDFKTLIQQVIMIISSKQQV